MKYWIFGLISTEIVVFGLPFLLYFIFKLELIVPIITIIICQIANIFFAKYFYKVLVEKEK